MTKPVWNRCLEAAPRLTRLLVLDECGEVFVAKVRYDRPGTFLYRTHENFIKSKHKIIDTVMDSEEVKSMVACDEPWEEVFSHNWTSWQRNFDAKPVAWIVEPPLPSRLPTLSDLERQILSAWEHCHWDMAILAFAAVADRARIDQKRVRRIVRALTRKEALKYCRTSWTEDGQTGGAGYQPTKIGWQLISCDLFLPERK